jgi:acyl dehydratase
MTSHIDARWLMSFAAGLGHSAPAYFDTTRADGIVNHPLFPIAVEWGLITAPGSGLDALGLTLAERLRGVHARHDLHLHRPIRVGTDVNVSAQIVGVEQTAPGALLTMRLDGSDDDGPLWTTWMGSLYRGVDVDGEDRLLATIPAHPIPGCDANESRSSTVPVEVWAPHVYSECARIWNPIHTDVVVARAAGLPGVILHGSANLAHGVDWVLSALDVGADRVRRVGGSFRGLVDVPSTISPTLGAVERAPDGTTTAHFTVFNAAGHPAVRGGFVVIRP